MLTFKKRLAEAVVDETTTIEVRLDEIYNRPTLVLAPLTAENKPWFNEAMRRQEARLKAEAVAESTGVAPAHTAEDIARERLRDAETLATYSVRDWRDLVDDEDKIAPYSPEAALVLMRELAESAPRVIARLVGIAGDVASFAKKPRMRAVEVAKNS